MLNYVLKSIRQHACYFSWEGGIRTPNMVSNNHPFYRLELQPNVKVTAWTTVGKYARSVSDLADRAGFEPAAVLRQEINSLPPATTRVPTNKKIKNPVSVYLTGLI